MELESLNLPMPRNTEDSRYYDELFFMNFGSKKFLNILIKIIIFINIFRDFHFIYINIRRQL